MKIHSSNYIKKLLGPCLIFSALTGISAAVIITLFRWLAEKVIHGSGIIYAFVRSHPLFLAALVPAAALLGFLAALLLTYAPSCKGGGIPTAVAALRGIVKFDWAKSIILLPISAIMTYVVGVPLGNEGPCVQMGTAIGGGTAWVVGGKKKRAWFRYIMTGGASAGFAMATGAPITAILFTMEEAHSRLSPLLFSVTSIAVIFSEICVELLEPIVHVPLKLFELPIPAHLPPYLLWLPLIVGIVCGGCAILFTRAYLRCDQFVQEKMKKIPFTVKLPIIFVSVAIIGFFSSDILGSGHSLIEKLFERESIWYLIIIFFLVRAILMMVANTSGVTGGVFLPTLTFGALLGALCSEAFIAMGVVSPDFHILFVTVGMVSFLGAASKIPLTACFFAIEALCDISNLIPVAIGVAVAFFIVEISGVDDFGATIVKAKANARRRGKTPIEVEVSLEVKEGAFVVDKIIKDILLPDSCVILSVNRRSKDSRGGALAEGDIINVHYVTYDPADTAMELEALVGEQSVGVRELMKV